MRQLHHECLEKQELVFSDEDLNVLGPDLELRSCQITLQLNAKHLTIIDALLVDCDITAKRQLRDFRWFTANMQGCRFHGKFLGNDFGFVSDENTKNGGIGKCDF